MSAERGAHEIARAAAQRIVNADAVGQAFGIELEDVGPGHATVSMDVTEAVLNGVKIAHGGVIFLLADSAFALASNSRGVETVARSAQIEFLRPARLGDRLTASARERTRLGRRGIYDVSVTTATGEPIAEFRGHS